VAGSFIRVTNKSADFAAASAVSQALSRQEYMDIKCNLHLADNSTVHACDKFYKLRSC